MERIEVVNRRELRDFTGEHNNRNISVSSRVESENTSRTTLYLSSCYAGMWVVKVMLHVFLHWLLGP